MTQPKNDSTVNIYYNWNDLSSVDFPVDQIVSSSQNHSYKKIERILDPTIVDRLKEDVINNDIQEEAYFLSAYLTLLFRYLNTQESSILVYQNGESSIAVSGLSISLANNISFLDLTKLIEEKYLSEVEITKKIIDYNIKDTKFIENKKSKLAYFYNKFNNNFSESLTEEMQNLFHLEIKVSEENYFISFYYSSLVLEYERIDRAMDHFSNILKSVALNNQLFLNEIPLLSEKEIDIIKNTNKTEYNFPSNKCLHELFEQQVKIQPDAVAIIQKEMVLTRDELNIRSNQIAHWIIKNKKYKNETVALYIDKSIDMVIGMLGILKAGCAYLPIDSSYPIERINYILDDSKVNIMLTQSSLEFSIKERNLFIWLLDENESKMGDILTKNPSISVSPSDLCYVIYTSGSTGLPKGVMLNHKGRVNNFHDFNSRFEINPNDKVLAVSSLSFDMCAYDILGSLMAGMCIVLPDPLLANQPIHWLKLISKHNITIWHSVPVMLNLLQEVAHHRSSLSIKSIRLALLGGDWIPIDLKSKVRQLNKHMQMIGLGGATEVSMDSIIYEIEDINENWHSIPYGKPMYNQTAFILDSNFELCPIGIAGELFIGGIGVGNGYYNKPQLTSEKFIEFGYKHEMYLGKLYRTGDLAKYDNNGTIILLGRVDFQVKINGVRIELGEIESHIKRHSIIEKSVVVASETNTGKILIAFIVVKQENSNTIKSLRKNLKNFLPDHFIPSTFIILDDIPTTPNGKVDRKKLIELGKLKYFKGG